MLDPPERPSSPIDSRKPLTLALGALLGLLLGVVLARVVDRVAPLRWSLLSGNAHGHDRTAELSGGAGRPVAGVEPALGFVLDATSDPGVRQEMAEASCDGSAYSVGVLKLAQRGLDSDGNGNGTSAIATGNGHASRMTKLLRDQDLPNGHTLWHLRDGLFASVLPDVSAVDAGKLLEEWVAKTEAFETDANGEPSPIEVWIAIVECNGGMPVNGQTSDTATG
jgi:hypothetical protein